MALRRRASHAPAPAERARRSRLSVVASPRMASMCACACPAQALLLQPDSHVIFSNRSAAYLKKGDLAEALADAEACVRVNPTWVKGYSRLAAALVALDRYDDCVSACRTGACLHVRRGAVPRIGGPGPAAGWRGGQGCMGSGLHG